MIGSILVIIDDGERWFRMADELCVNGEPTIIVTYQLCKVCIWETTTSKTTRSQFHGAKTMETTEAAAQIDSAHQLVHEINVRATDHSSS